MKKKIFADLIPHAYKISKEVYEGKFSVSQGVKLIAGDNKMNSASAQDYIYIFRYLMLGRKFSRTLNTDSMDYYFKNILTDYGVSNLANPLSSLEKHYTYYEDLQKTTMFQMRAIHKKYSEIFENYMNKSDEPVLITNKNQLIQNINTLEFFLTEGTDDQRQESSDLIKNGICFVAYTIDNEIRFAPSRFIGYENNKPSQYPNVKVYGGDTNSAISDILQSKPLVNDLLEVKYLDYCERLGIRPNPKGGAFSNPRKFWILELYAEFRNSTEIGGEFPEGKIVERSHIARERNTKVISVAKSNFKKKHGHLYCEVCKIDFGKKYGEIGKDFIEGHHTIAICDMPPEYKTKPEEIAMLCPNCHKMVHRKRPWLSIDELSKLLINS